MRRRLGCLVLASVALLACAGCGGGARDSMDACGPGVSGSPTRLEYRASADADRVVPVLCERLAGLKIDYRVRRSGADRIVVEVPRTLPAGVLSSDVRAAARPGRLSFYDWEANVVGPSGRPEPGDRTVTGASGAGEVGSLPLYDAVLLAAERPATVEPDNARQGGVFYAVDPRSRTVYGSGARAVALATVPAARRDRARVYEVKPDTVIVHAEVTFDSPKPPNRWFVLQDDVALGGSEIRDPKASIDESPGGDGSPIVTFGFTAKGANDWRRLTREIARRGSASAGPGLRGRGAADANQHFAIVLDDRIVSIPYVDFRANPDGIDAARGSQIQGGFTIASARQLAAILRTGALAAPLQPIPPAAP